MPRLTETAAVFCSRFIPSLLHRDYRVMWLGHVVGESSSWALGAAEGWLIFTLADSNPSSWVGGVFFAAMLPWFFVPVIVGVLTDRFERRNILALAYLISFFHAVVLTLLVFTGLIQVWHIIVLALINGAARAVHMGGIEALAANLVPARELPNAYTLVSAGYYATRLIGPGLITPLMAVANIKWVFLGCTLFYFLGLCLVLQINTVSTGTINPERSLMYNILSGVKYVYSNSILRNIIFIVMLHCTLVMSFESLLPAVSNTQLNSDGKGVAYLHMMIGLGALAASICLAPIHGRGLLGILFLTSAIISSIGNLILGMSSSLQLAMTGTVIIGLSHAAFMTIATITIQSVSPDGLRGRITSIYLIHAGGLMSFSYFINGALADIFKTSVILSIGSAAFFLAILCSYFLPTPKRLYMRGSTIR